MSEEESCLFGLWAGVPFPPVREEPEEGEPEKAPEKPEEDATS